MEINREDDINKDRAHTPLELSQRLLELTLVTSLNQIQYGHEFTFTPDTIEEWKDFVYLAEMIQAVRGDIVVTIKLPQTNNNDTPIARTSSELNKIKEIINTAEYTECVAELFAISYNGTLWYSNLDERELITKLLSIVKRRFPHFNEKQFNIGLISLSTDDQEIPDTEDEYTTSNPQLQEVEMHTDPDIYIETPAHIKAIQLKRRIQEAQENVPYKIQSKLRWIRRYNKPAWFLLIPLIETYKLSSDLIYIILILFKYEDVEEIKEKNNEFKITEERIPRVMRLWRKITQFEDVENIPIRSEPFSSSDYVMYQNHISEYIEKRKEKLKNTLFAILLTVFLSGCTLFLLNNIFSRDVFTLGERIEELSWLEDMNQKKNIDDYLLSIQEKEFLILYILTYNPAATRNQLKKYSTTALQTEAKGLNDGDIPVPNQHSFQIRKTILAQKLLKIQSSIVGSNFVATNTDTMSVHLESRSSLFRRKTQNPDAKRGLVISSDEEIVIDETMLDKAPLGLKLVETYTYCIENGTIKQQERTLCNNGKVKYYVLLEPDTKNKYIPPSEAARN